MQMDTVISQFRDLCDNPVAWAILAAVAIKAAVSTVEFLRCPYVNHVDAISAEQARAELSRRTLHNPRFLVAMSAALTLTIGGLYAARAPELATWALGAIVAGVFLLLVAPSQLQIADGRLRVAATRAEGGAALSFAADRLRRAHLERLGIEIAFAAAFALLVVVF